jgi:hypothetical protein
MRAKLRIWQAEVGSPWRGDAAGVLASDAGLP